MKKKVGAIIILTPQENSAPVIKGNLFIGEGLVATTERRFAKVFNTSKKFLQEILENVERDYSHLNCKASIREIWEM